LPELPERTATWLRRIQNDLFDLAPTSRSGSDTRERLRLLPEQVGWLEQRCDEVNAELERCAVRALGGTPAAAWLHVCRRSAGARATLVALGADASPETCAISTASDLLFILAREANGGEEPLWSRSER